ncbi:T9SS type B sorting domain-containing protein [Flavobacterium sp. PLA-1-15]|uniref:T9SS type B sorting domain-containing protein n=1 Tax=Flavobacterium sp. PLA-1-15 TaxID=3380533 RepID=UPI003B7BE01D
MAKKLLILLLICFGQFIYAQKESSIWYFGRQAGLNFNTSSPIVLDDGAMDTFEGSATISDASGQLLFYTNGEKVWNRNHQLMSNGTDLMGSSSSSQACIIIPKPDSPNLYYIFTTDEFGNSKGLRYSEVDISLENGLGNITTNKNILLASPTCEKLTAVKHSNNSDYWIVTHNFGSNKFMSYSVTNLGVNPTPVVSAVGISITSPGETVGSLKASLDGSKMASCNYQKNLELYDFDASTGKLSNAKIINSKSSNYGAEFSPSGNYLYVTTGSNNYIQEIVQYDLMSPNVSTSSTLLNTTNSQFGALQLANDGKIYVSLANSKYLGIIHQPENLGQTCNFEKNGLFLNQGMCVFGLPQSLPIGFNIFIASRSVCLGSPTQFSITGNQTVVSANWDFGDGTFSSVLSPSHTYTTPGTYTVTVNAQSNSGTIISQTSKVVIATIPVAHSIKNTAVCDSTIPYNLTQHDNEVKGLQNNSLFKVAYFASEENAIAHNNILQSPHTLTPGTNTFFAKIYNNENINCASVTSFKVILLNPIIAGQPVDYVICESPYDGVANFNFALKDNEVLNGLDSSQYGVTYYNHFDNAVSATGSLPILYTNTTMQETIFARLESKLNANCFAITSFKIVVGEQPVIGPLTNLIDCGANASFFDLTDKNAEVLGGLSPNAFSVKYYHTEQQALEGSSAIIMPYFTNLTNQTIYVAVQNINISGCKAISSFNLTVLPALPTALPKSINVCDDLSNDGVAVFDFEEQTTYLLDGQPLGTVEITYHTSEAEAIVGSNSINDFSNTSNPQTIFSRVTSGADPSCFEIRPFTIAVNKQPTAITPDDIYLCSDQADMSATIDLESLIEEVLAGQSTTDFTVTFHESLSEAQLGRGALPYLYEAAIGNHTLHVRVENVNNPSCYIVVDFDISVYPKPVINMKTQFTLCENKDNTIEIVAPPGFDYYSWSTGATTRSIFVSTPGAITLTVGNIYQGVTCSESLVINVITSSVAVIRELRVSDWTDSENSIEIIVEGAGNYEYSIDGENYQSSPKFNGLEVGEYIVYVKDINGCGVVSQQTYFLIYPKFFTPNGDGYNEKWQIKPSVLEPELKVFIFDFSGKLITFLDGRSDGWDGTFNNQKLPSDDYWFVVERKSGKTFKGHFTLMR